ncbi:MAG: endolytic transglycosylase MltG [Patescibacteria group bacterium]|nr:endolytic transglycosylase MltG [Patescibacteria group bacterium]
MTRGYAYGKRQSKFPQRIGFIVGSIIVVIILGLLFVSVQYAAGLRSVSNDQQTEIFTVEKGSSVKLIATNLEQKKLIRSAWAMQRYIRSKSLDEKVQAGTYAFSPSQGTKEIVKKLTTGRVSARLVTILPGQRIDQIRAEFINDGFSPNSVDEALNPANYSALPIMAFKPQSVQTLEGLLWPESFEKGETTLPSEIIKLSLIAMGEHITPEVQSGFAAHNLSVYQGLIVASIVTQEVNKPADQAQAAQVFLKRLKVGMMLGSDVTANYGAIAVGRTPDLRYDSPYNTLKHPGLPPTPISSVTEFSLTATLHPAGTDWTYFVAGDDGTTYFSRTLAEHEALSAKYCHKLCGR